MKKFVGIDPNMRWRNFGRVSRMKNITLGRRFFREHCIQVIVTNQMDDSGPAPLQFFEQFWQGAGLSVHEFEPNCQLASAGSEDAIQILRQKAPLVDQDAAANLLPAVCVPELKIFGPSPCRDPFGVLQEEFRVSRDLRMTVEHVNHPGRSTALTCIDNKTSHHYQMEVISRDAPTV